ncbi:MAG TPA: hypothetical protein VIS76_17425 [Pseudomonadales bacterium]
MNWEAVGAIAELVAALTVIVTLVYLSAQIRQNTEAVRHSTARAVMEDATRWQFSLINDPDVARIYLAGLRNGLDSPADRLRFNMLMRALIEHWNHVFKFGEEMDLPAVDYVLSQVGAASYWRRNVSKRLEPGFIDFINARLNEIESSVEAPALGT